MRLHQLLVALPILSMACGPEAPAPNAPVVTPRVEEPMPAPMPPPAATGRNRLAKGVWVELEPSVSTISMRVGRSNETTTTASTAPLISGGRMFVRASEQNDERLSGSVTIEMADVTLGSHLFPPHGLTLVGIKGTLSFDHVDTVWSDERSATFAGTAGLRVEWSIMTADGARPARTLQVPAIPVRGGLLFDGVDRVSLAFGGQADGQLFDVSGFAQVSQLAFDLALAEER